MNEYVHTLYLLFKFTIHLLLSLQAGLEITPEDCLISYLPLAHSYERLAEVQTCYLLIGYFHG